MGQVDLLRAALAEEFLDLVTATGKGSRNGRRGWSGWWSLRWGKCLTTLKAKLGCRRVDMFALGAREFSLQCPAASHTEFSIVGKFSLAMRALHVSHPHHPGMLQSTTADYISQGTQKVTTYYIALVQWLQQNPSLTSPIGGQAPAFFTWLPI